MEPVLRAKPGRLEHRGDPGVPRGYGKGDPIGSVEADKLADFVLLNRNSLDYIRNLRAITDVFQGSVAVDKDVSPVHPSVTTHPA
ncbi:hypothetical protein NLM24_32410 [Nocardia zapadnayensis]|uniref:hypothetical protein n=1 Tax=Nocardia rhamnosiphila TaxID=426716 RepID=UPI0022454FF1|nr:hypothetical protein [Nocardia zapadnayensis]MCX0275300.1 hypothetical protein [Nocardia zapadnayensis]